VRVNVLVHLLQQCDKLRTLVLDCDIDSYCADIVPLMRHLHCLSVFGILSDECLCLIAQHCKQLKALNIPCSHKVNRNLAIGMHQSAVEAGMGDARVMQCADTETFGDDDMYTEKGLLALMDELPNLRMLLDSMVSNYSVDRAAIYMMVQTLWQRLRPGIQFKEWDTCLNFNVLSVFKHFVACLIQLHHNHN